MISSFGCATADIGMAIFKVHARAIEGIIDSRWSVEPCTKHKARQDPFQYEGTRGIHLPDPSRFVIRNSFGNFIPFGLSLVSMARFFHRCQIHLVQPNCLPEDGVWSPQMSSVTESGIFVVQSTTEHLARGVRSLCPTIEPCEYVKRGLGWRITRFAEIDE
jgi:hypothetical protein